MRQWLDLGEGRPFLTVFAPGMQYSRMLVILYMYKSTFLGMCLVPRVCAIL